jgi:hypothetical protein
LQRIATKEDIQFPLRILGIAIVKRICRGSGNATRRYHKRDSADKTPMERAGLCSN